MKSITINNCQHQPMLSVAAVQRHLVHYHTYGNKHYQSIKNYTRHANRLYMIGCDSIDVTVVFDRKAQCCVKCLFLYVGVLVINIFPQFGHIQFSLCDVLQSSVDAVVIKGLLARGCFERRQP